MKHQAREDRRVRQLHAEQEAARRKLLPVIDVVCKLYRVMPADLLAHHNLQSDLNMARNLVTWIGHTHLKIGTTILAAVLERDRAATSQKLARLRVLIITSDSFKRQVDAVLRRVRRPAGSGA